MDTGLALLLGELMKTSIAAYLSYLRLQGKTEEEVQAIFDAELKKALAFNPNDIKDL